jgi:hypothetical protein
VKVSSEESGGVFTLLDNTNPAGTFLPPHVHKREDETFYILEGEFEFKVAGQTLTAGLELRSLLPAMFPTRSRSSASLQAGRLC